MSEIKKLSEYRVIGWTSCMDNNYPDDNDCCKEKFNALIEDIRKNGYIFGGDRHEDYCPVFNDGTKLCFSWRGWGGVMAEAWHPEDKDPYKYSLYYMDEFIKPEFKKVPKRGVDDMEIDLKVWRDFKLGDGEYWEMYFAPLFAIELRPLTPELEKIERGDFIDIINVDEPSLHFCARTYYVCKAQTIEEVLKMLYDNLEGWIDIAEGVGLEPKLPLDKIAERLKEKFKGKNENGFWAMHYRTV